MIKSVGAGHSSGRTMMTQQLDSALCPPEQGRREAAAPPERLRELIDRHHDFVWRTLRYLGIAESSIDDCSQRVLCILARKLDQVAPGAEMSFLFSTAMRVASEERRAERRRRVAPDAVDFESLVAPGPSADELLDEQRALEVLQGVLDAMPLELRVVFVLFEIEELTMAQIADLLEIAPGTAASRLRRARQEFRSIVRRVQAARGRRASGGNP